MRNRGGRGIGPLRQGYGQSGLRGGGWFGGGIRLQGGIGFRWLDGRLRCGGRRDGFLLGDGFGIFGLNLFPEGEQFEAADFGGLVGVATQGGRDGLDDGFGDGFVAGFAFPVIKYVGKPTDDGGVGVAVAVLEAEEFTQFFEGGLHESILPH